MAFETAAAGASFSFSFCCRSLASFSFCFSRSLALSRACSRQTWSTRCFRKFSILVFSWESLCACNIRCTSTRSITRLSRAFPRHTRNTFLFLNSLATVCRACPFDHSSRLAWAQISPERIHDTPSAERRQKSSGSCARTTRRSNQSSSSSSSSVAELPVRAVLLRAISTTSVVCG